jgi:hypothetical protein
MAYAVHGEVTADATSRPRRRVLTPNCKLMVLAEWELATEPGQRRRPSCAGRACTPRCCPTGAARRAKVRSWPTRDAARVAGAAPAGPKWSACAGRTPRREDRQGSEQL